MDKNFILSGVAAEWVDHLLYEGNRKEDFFYLNQSAARIVSTIAFPIFAALDVPIQIYKICRAYTKVLSAKNELTALKARVEVARHKDLLERCFLGVLCSPAGLICSDIVTQHFVMKYKESGKVTPYGKLYSEEVEEVTPRSIEEIQEVIHRARENGKKVSIAGAQMSQGKQILPPNKGDIVLNMENFNKVQIDSDKKIAKVGSGATWADIQRQANEYGLGIRVMQASNVFSVGGSISANCHGWDHRSGTLSNTVKSLTIIDAEGNIRKLTPEDELFGLVAGGYGGFGVILSAEISLADNLLLETQSAIVDTSDYVNYFKNKILTDDKITMHLYRLSLDPNNLFGEAIATNYVKIGSERVITPLADEPERGWRLDRIKLHCIRRFKSLISLAWKLEKKAMQVKEVQSRNEIMRPIINPVFNNSKVDTEWLQEYFVKGEDLDDFLKFLAKTLKDNDVPLYNASVRYVTKDNLSKLGYANKGDRFAIVLFFNQPLNPEKINKTEKWVKKVIDYLNERDGSYYLPYMHFATKEQFQKAYPQWRYVAVKKDQYDPDHLFVNGLYKDYVLPNVREKLGKGQQAEDLTA